VLSPKQTSVLRKIVFGSYEPERRDARTLQCLERRGLIKQQPPPDGFFLVPPDYRSTRKGKRLVLIPGGRDDDV
jgi:hypothetical protein